MSETLDAPPPPDPPEPSDRGLDAAPPEEAVEPIDPGDEAEEEAPPEDSTPVIDAEVADPLADEAQAEAPAEEVRSEPVESDDFDGVGDEASREAPADHPEEGTAPDTMPDEATADAAPADWQEGETVDLAEDRMAEGVGSGVEHGPLPGEAPTSPLANLEAQPTVDGPTGPDDGDGRPDTPTLSDQQASDTVDSVRQIGLDQNRWTAMTPEERADALPEIEVAMADAVGRPPCEVYVESMEPYQYGYFDPASGSLHINQAFLERGDDFGQVIDTMAHEGRHAYQAHAIENDGFHSDEAEVQSWKANSEDYMSVELDGYEQYRNQPLEADAWSFGEAVRKGVTPT